MRRSLLKLTRLAVTLTTQPPSKRRRALAMSSRPESTGTPTASTATSGVPTSSWIRSMSWIIRSSTTSTSVPRRLNGATRWDSTNSGRSSTSSSARIAALKRSRWPTWSTRPWRGGERDQGVGLVQGRGDRLLEEDIDAALEQAARHRNVLAGRHGDARHVDPADQVVGAGQRQDAEALGQAARRVRIAIDHRDQAGIRTGGIFVGVMSAEMAAADHRGAKRAHAGINGSSSAASALCSIRSTISAITSASA